MFDQVNELFKKKNVLSHKNQGITVASVADTEAGFDLAAAILYGVVDRKAVLYLSGGSVKGLYEKLTKEEKLHPGAVGIIDERFGEKFHQNSNEKMIRETGLLRYLEILDIPFYPVLQPDKSREEAAQDYDEKVRSLHATFQKSIGILGIGPDGHTAGMPALSSKFIHSASSGQAISNFKLDAHSLVTEYNDTSGKYGERVTMTFLGLLMQDLLMLLVFGDDKKEALDLMFADGLEQEIPARFYKRPDVAKKTLLITDQRV